MNFWAGFMASILLFMITVSEAKSFLKRKVPLWKAPAEAKFWYRYFSAKNR